MVNSGTTISWEAWDLKYKPNQDWNHAWGAAPANLLPRFVLGVEAITPGGDLLRIRPHPGKLDRAAGKVPTHHGAVGISWTQNESFQLMVTLPAGVSARVELPAAGPDQQVYLNNHPVDATHSDQRWVLDLPITDAVSHLEVK
jgi:hypothetical protein